MTPTVIADSREQKPYEFPAMETEVAALPVGDYTYQGFEETFAVERKSVEDLASSLGTDRNRFENEIRRVNGHAHRNEDGNPLPGTKPDYHLDDFSVVIEENPRRLREYAKMLDRKGWTIHEAKNRALNGQFRAPYLSAMHPNAILGTIESWQDKYPVLDFVWCGNRERAKDETLALLDQWYMKHGDIMAD